MTTAGCPWLRRLHLALCALCALALTGTALLLFVIEPSWLPKEERTPAERFAHGSIGTEILPLPVLQVLPRMFPERWQPAGPQAGDWIDQFGFLHDPARSDGLPRGFAVSHHRPKSGDPTPVPFVGFACALCHTAEYPTGPEDKPVTVIAAGNHSLDLFAWVDCLLGSIADPRLTVESIDAAHAKHQNRSLTLTEKLMIGMWLRTAQSGVRASFAKWETPFAGAEVRDSRLLPNGPSRTQAFRELVRFVVDRPATFDHGYSKLPAIFEQGHREWAQVDGSVKSPAARSVFAALAAGATVRNLTMPDILANVESNISYIDALKGPRWDEVFPKHPIDQARAARGKEVYRQHCFSCHGWRGDAPGSWVAGPRQGVVMPVEATGTDPARVSIRHYDEMTNRLFAMLPDGSPLKPPRDEIRPGPDGSRVRGYINAPLESMFVRVPYLHNGSVLTLAELINLKPRRAAFWRGRNYYDPVDVGLKSPPAEDPAKAPDTRHYWWFDTARPGNGNAGHDFPWTFKGPGWNEEALKDLLEFCKTL